MPKSLADRILAHERRKARLTPRKQAFIREIARDASNATQAAIRAGYAPRSAHVTASRLLQDEAVKSALAQHFIDKETMLSEALSDTLVRLHQIVQAGKVETSIRAAKTLLHYTKIASDVLGLRVKESKDTVQEAPMTVDQLIKAHEDELERLRAVKTNTSLSVPPELLAGSPAAQGSAPLSGEGAVH